MAKEIKDLAKLTFDGPRFEDHGLEIDDLAELLAYKRLLVDTAREFWKRQHPDRARIQKGWEDSISIKLYGIGTGSACVALKRELTAFNDELSIPLHPDELMQLDTPDEFDEAAEVLQD